jgi:peptidoglycan/LPS O-acetylase OafA/YrhL
MRRTILGILAILFLLAAAILYYFGPLDATWQMLRNNAVRIGLVLGAFWLAYPQLSRIPWWFVQAMLAAALVIAINPRVAPKVALIVLPLLLVLWIVRPRKGKREKATKPVAKRTKSAATSRPKR